ncbi:MAG: type 4 prepilin-like proteins leader peptide-processing enzyme [Patescibacteria group bacterium]|nr:MAG: type 4 prepilin-like proteins leader peptide-processing enzyme [Patescibacteria group bacterium]
MIWNYVGYISLFVLGLFLGSFLNLVSDRVVKGGKIVFGHSKCDYCKNILKVKNLVPLLSFIIQCGKCSECKKPLSWYYPFSEILAGLLVVLASQISKFKLFVDFSFSNFAGFVFLVVVFSFFEILLLTDLKYLLIPDKIVLPAIVFVVLFNIISTAISLYDFKIKLENDDFGKYLLKVGFFEDQVMAAIRTLGINFISALAIALFFFFIVWITKGKGMGGGDIRLALLVGLVNGFPYNFLAIFLGFFIGAVVSIGLVIGKKKTLKSVVPFGPFLILGSLLCFVWGSQILNWYLNLF